MTETEMRNKLANMMDALSFGANNLLLAVEQSDACDAWVVGKDEPSCNAMRGTAQDLVDRVNLLKFKVGNEEDLNLDFLDHIEKHSEIIVDGIEYQYGVTQTSVIRDTVNATINDLRVYVGVAVKAVKKYAMPTGLLVAGFLLLGVFLYGKGRA